jgi:hypothetical protein
LVQGNRFNCNGGDGRTFAVTLIDRHGTYEVVRR